MNHENIAVSASKHQRELIGNVFAEDLLATLPSPLSDDQAKGLRDMADTEGAQAGAAYRHDKHAEMETAQTAKNHLDAKMKTTSARLETAEQELAKRRADPGSAILMVFAALCFLACVVAEYDVSLGTITWALSIRPDSFTGVMLALACAVSPIILKAPITQLIWEPWQQARSQPDHPRKTRLLDQAIDHDLIEGYERHIVKLNLPDPDDRHVLAAAIEAGAEIRPDAGSPGLIIKDPAPGADRALARSPILVPAKPRYFPRSAPARPHQSGLRG
jgi:hypothetical protein